MSSENYKGKWVFVENRGEEAISYYNGEYFCVRQTPWDIYGVKFGGGYNSHDVRTFSLKGESAYEVIDSREDNGESSELIQQLTEFIDSPEPKQYIETVYSTAKNTLAAVRRAVRENKKPPTKDTMADLFEEFAARLRALPSS